MSAAFGDIGHSISSGLRLRRAEPQPYKGDERDGEGTDACHLGGFEDAQHEIGVVAAQIFEKEAGERVEHDVECEALSFGMAA